MAVLCKCKPLRSVFFRNLKKFRRRGWIDAAHRLQLMRRLKIGNIPGLVRFAIRTGLVSPEE
jgi:hypothetical protein